MTAQQCISFFSLFCNDLSGIGFEGNIDDSIYKLLPWRLVEFQKEIGHNGVCAN